MKKILKTLTVLSLLTTASLGAETYITNIGNKALTKNISVEPFIPEEVEEILECVLPETLNETGDACELTCELPNILNEAGDSCINNVVAVGWIDTSDTCGGMRSTNFDPNIVYARSKSAYMNLNLEIPQGYRWLTTTEFRNLYNQSTLPNKEYDGDNSYAYYSKCGLSNYPYSQQENIIQLGISFKDSNGTGIHTGHMPVQHYTNNTYLYSDRWLGYVLYKEY